MADSHTEDANVRGRTSHAGVVFDARTRRVSGVLCFGLRSAAASSASRALARRDSWEEADARFPSRAAEGRKKKWRRIHQLTFPHRHADPPQGSSSSLSHLWRANCLHQQSSAWRNTFHFYTAHNLGIHASIKTHALFCAQQQPSDDSASRRQELMMING